MTRLRSVSELSPHISAAGALLLLVILYPVALEAQTEKKQGSGSQTSRKALSGQPDIIAMEKALLRLTNLVRKHKRLDQFSPSSTLQQVARRQSSNMCSARSLQHDSDLYPKGWRTFGDRMTMIGVTSAAENIALRTVSGGPEEWAAEVMRGWIRSDSHRANLLNPKFSHMGIGVVQCSGNVAYATQIFSCEPGSLGRESRGPFPESRSR